MLASIGTGETIHTFPLIRARMGQRGTHGHGRGRHSWASDPHEGSPGGATHEPFRLCGQEGVPSIAVELRVMVSGLNVWAR